MAILDFNGFGWDSQLTYNKNCQLKLLKKKTSKKYMLTVSFCDRRESFFVI